MTFVSRARVNLCRIKYRHWALAFRTYGSSPTVSAFLLSGEFGMKYRMITIAGSGLAMTAALAGGAPATRRASAATTGKTAAQEFKNIQVLADELIPTMQFISASLGVECEFCHVERQMGKDDKKTKKTAREMIRMVLAINQNNFSGQREVTCNTCHRGAIRPEAIPVVRVEARKPATTEGDQDDETARANWPSGDAVLAKYLDALGGKAALDKVTTRVEKGNAILGSGRGLPIEIYAKAPDLRVSVMHTPNGESVTGYNGNDGWLASPGRGSREMSDSDDHAAKLDATACSHRTWLQCWVSSSCNHIPRRLEIVPLRWCGQRQKASRR
jgi:hypothetical protein